VYQPGDAWTVSSTTADKVFYAQWKTIVTVTYKPGAGATGTDVVQKPTTTAFPGGVPAGNNVDVTFHTNAETNFAPTVPGMKLISWTTNSDGTGDRYLPGEIKTLNQPLTLYGQWSSVEDVSVSNNVTGDYADLTKKFAYTLTLKTAADGVPTGGLGLSKFNFAMENGGTDMEGVGTGMTGGTFDLNAEGAVKFTLSVGQKITIKDVPADYTVRIVQEDDNIYTVSHKADENGYSFAKDEADADSTANDTGEQALNGSGLLVKYVNERITVPPTGVKLGDNGAALLLGGIGLGAGLAPIPIRAARRRKKEQGGSHR
jgi:hypothetical protein